jgi:multiple sugar transport system substrate-binding protein
MSSSFIRPTRRNFLAGSAAIGAAGLLGIKPASAAVDWKRFAGTTLEVNLVKSPRSETILNI